MSPEKWSDERLDDLAYQVRAVAAVAAQVATHHAEISGLKDDDLAMREALREAMSRMEKALGSVARTCEDHTTAVRMDVREQNAEIRKLTAAQRWTPTQWAAILGPTLTALIGAAALVLTKGSP